MADITTMQDLEVVQPTTPSNPVLRVGQKVNTTNTTLIVNFEPLDSAGASITKDFFIGVVRSDGYIETMKVTNVSTTTLTVVRGMKRGGLEFTTGDASLGVSHEVGEQVIFNFTASLYDMIYGALTGSVGITPKLAGPTTYQDTGILRARVFANDAARDAAITSPSNGDGCYHTGNGALQGYIGGSWQDLGTSSTPNASATVAGKVEIATTAESTAGTDTGGTGALLSALPSDIAKNTQSGAFISGTASSADTKTMTLTPTLTVYATGQLFVVTNTTVNTGAVTINIDTLGAKAVVTLQGGALIAGDMANTTSYILYYNGTSFVLINQVASSQTRKGSIEVATQAEVTTGTDTERAVTPATLAGRTKNVVGTGLSRNITTIYQASTAGILFFWATPTASNSVTVDLISDSSATPSTNVGQVTSYNSNTFTFNMTYPIIKDDYYQMVTSSGILSVLHATFFPLG